MKIACLTFLLLLIFNSCKDKSKYREAADEIATELPNAKNMNVGKEKYTLYIPAGWSTEHRTEYGVNYYFLLAPKTAEDPNTSINVTTEYMQNLSLSDYRIKAIESLRKAIPSVSILEQGDITANGIPGNWYSYDMEPQGIKSTLVSYIFPKDGIAYTITAGTQTKDAGHYRNLFDSVARSFKFIK